jgi:transcription elongation factor GreA
MTDKSMYITKDGLDNLKAELHDLVTVKRTEVLEEIKKARSFGDLSENALYDQARAQQANLEGRIQELEQIIEQAKVIELKDDGSVQLGSKVMVHVEGDQEEFMIVGEPEADPTNAKISSTSPLGQALIGKKIGDEVQVEAPVGAITYRILKVG